VGKDLLALLRDSVLFLLALFLVFAPRQLNGMLERAGFEEGVLVGFKWKSTVAESNRALDEAHAAIAALQTKNDELVKALADANGKLKDPALTNRIATLEAENAKLRVTSTQVQTTVAQTIQANQTALAANRPKSDLTVGLQILGPRMTSGLCSTRSWPPRGMGSIRPAGHTQRTRDPRGSRSDPRSSTTRRRRFQQPSNSRAS
jgi:hypothetical protein